MMKIDWISDFVFGRVFGFIDGYKTYVFSAYLFMKGLFGLCGHYWPDVGFDSMPLQEAVHYMEAGTAGICAKSAMAKTTPEACK
jgi:hypothetical protein